MPVTSCPRCRDEGIELMCVGESNYEVCGHVLKWGMCSVFIDGLRPLE